MQQNNTLEAQKTQQTKLQNPYENMATKSSSQIRLEPKLQEFDP